jgi:hypothetical protein
MKKEFIPYKQALALKELGFDEPCFGRWLIITEWEAPTGEIRLQLGAEAESYDKNQCTAPLYQQAFRWFREKYKIHIVINLTIIDNWYFELYDLNDKRNAEIKTNQNEFETYKKAELECIKKLIEIVKNK